ncbi:hypothetical protein BDP27DRAFT_1433874 [Rhodocollybia butyracea]|uniref:Uncharacterized protein n=1 Tax=Rhodocollybia butyracea TaxID=206335 RepID=A0A9P5P6R5_9AGAR|nr:hypothetical protein BDP27DRAFT_1433874 [Rhodocollybia butyracea]
MSSALHFAISLYFAVGLAYIYVKADSDQESTKESPSSDIEIVETPQVHASMKRLHMDANNSDDEPLRKRSRSAEITSTTTAGSSSSSSTASPMDPTLLFLMSRPVAIMHKSSEDLYKK